MHVLRSVVGIIVALAFMLTFAGLVAPVLAGIAGVAGFLAANGMSAVIGGWLAARVAGYAEFTHALALAVILAVGTFAAASAVPPGHQPGWYVPVAGIVGVTGVLVGGWIRAAAALAPRP